MTRIHLSLPTRDLDAAVAFYSTLFDVAPDKVHDDHVRFQPADVPIALALTPGAPSVTDDVHQGIKLAGVDAVHAATERFAAAGIEHKVESGPCCYAGLERVWVRDPDGRPWEVYTVTDDGETQFASEDGTCCVPEQAAPESTGSCCG